MASGAVSAARMMSSEVPRLRVLVAGLVRGKVRKGVQKFWGGVGRKQWGKGEVGNTFVGTFS